MHWSFIVFVGSNETIYPQTYNFLLCNTFLSNSDYTFIVGFIGGFAKRAHPARARYLNVNFARRNRDLQPRGKEIEGGGGGGGDEEEKSDSW